MNSIETMLEKLKGISPTQKKKNFESRRTIDKLFLNFRGNYGKYQLLPLNSVISEELPFVVLNNTREINIPRKNIAADGTESVYNAWIRLLPASAYKVRDISSNREVSSLTAADEALLKQAHNVWEELYAEVDGRNNAMDPNISSLIRRKNYTIFHAFCSSFWELGGDMRRPSRQNFSGLFVVTAKDFIDVVTANIEETCMLEDSNTDWTKDLYNRDLTNRKGFVMLSINKKESGPGFNISVNHKLNAEYTKDIVIPEEDAELMQNPVETFLGWQARRDDDTPAAQRNLFNRPLIEEAIHYMVEQLAKIRISKQSGVSIADAIAATNEKILKEQVATDSRGVETNDPVLSQMAEKAREMSYSNPGEYGSEFAAKPVNPQRVMQENDNPMSNPSSSHIDPITSTPVFDQPEFAKWGNRGNGSTPF